MLEKQINIKQLLSLNLPDQEAYCLLWLRVGSICLAHDPWYHVQAHKKRTGVSYQRPHGAVCQAVSHVLGAIGHIVAEAIPGRPLKLINSLLRTMSFSIYYLKQNKEQSCQTLSFLSGYYLTTQPLFTTTHLKRAVFELPLLL